MAGNPYTEQGMRLRILDMLANRADVWNLGDVLPDITSVLRILLRARDVVMAANRAYIASAATADATRTTPPFQLQGSYRDPRLRSHTTHRKSCRHVQLATEWFLTTSFPERYAADGDITAEPAMKGSPPSHIGVGGR
ncbi:hypothetical protein ACL02S_18415 [Nocardia sp. 004]|uniref:hypothetical protein n=1 Tax=Nocardia sp. 004 TaxID=3385978 RepID=UPI0039A039E8